MRKLFTFLMCSILISCNEHAEIEELIMSSDQTVKTVVLPSKSLYYDEIYQIRNGVEIDLTMDQFQTKAISSHEFYEITTVSPTYIFAGSVMSAESINQGVYRPVGYANIWKPLVTVSFTLPVRSKEISPKKSSFQSAIVEAIGDRDFSGKQSQIFTYKMKEFRYFDELKLAFGSNVNIGNFFNITAGSTTGKTNAVSALFVDFSQIYFSVDMDIPDDGNIFLTEENRQQNLAFNPVYVNSVNYGRKGVLMVESNKSYQETSVAIRAAFNAKIVNGELSLDIATKKILEEAQIQICIIGGDGEGATKTVVGFHEFQNFIIKGGVYSKEVFGYPISFGAAYARDNSMFLTKFDVQHE